MDYPHPLVTLGPDAQIDLSDAYDVGHRGMGRPWR